DLHHRALHSFPTRRSSDLAHCRLELPGKAVSLQVTPRREHRDLRLEALAGYALCDGEAEVHVRLIFHPLGPDDLEEAARPDVTRSEEHTSELQSRGHLVCR